MHVLEVLFANPGRASQCSSQDLWPATWNASKTYCPVLDVFPLCTTRLSEIDFLRLSAAWLPHQPARSRLNRLCLDHCFYPTCNEIQSHRKDNLWNYQLLGQQSWVLYTIRLTRSSRSTSSRAVPFIRAVRAVKPDTIANLCVGNTTTIATALELMICAWDVRDYKGRNTEHTQFSDWSTILHSFLYKGAHMSEVWQDFSFISSPWGVDQKNHSRLAQNHKYMLG